MRQQRSVVFAAIAIGFLSIAFSSFKRYTERINCTELNGAGCVCHGVVMSDSVRTWVTGPAQLEANQTAIFRAYLAGGPALGGGYNVAVRYGIMSAVDSFSVLVDNELTQAMPLVFPTREDTLYWDFAYTAPDTICTDTIYSCGLSTNNDGAPDIGDEWSFGPKFPVQIIPKTVPVELLFFNLTNDNRVIKLFWTTASEKNNKEFLVETLDNTSDKWKLFKSIPGSGTAINPNDYSVSVDNHSGTLKSIRLSQRDYDGRLRVLKIAEVEAESSAGTRNIKIFPNPANDFLSVLIPDTKSQKMILEFFNLSGELIHSESASMVSGEQVIATQISQFLGSSGVYLLRVRTDSKTYTSKLVYIRQ